MIQPSAANYSLESTTETTKSALEVKRKRYQTYINPSLYQNKSHLTNCHKVSYQHTLTVDQ